MESSLSKLDRIRNNVKTKKSLYEISKEQEPHENTSIEKPDLKQIPEPEPELSAYAKAIISILSVNQGIAMTRTILTSMKTKYENITLYDLNTVLEIELKERKLVQKVQDNPPVWKLLIYSSPVDNNAFSNIETESKSLVSIFVDLESVKRWDLNPILPFIGKNKQLFGFGEAHTRTEEWFALMSQYNTKETETVKYCAQTKMKNVVTVPILMATHAVSLIRTYYVKKKPLSILILSKNEQSLVLPLIPHVLGSKYAKSTLLVIQKMEKIVDILRFIEE